MTYRPPQDLSRPRLAPDLLRAADRFFGAPLCALVTFVRKIGACLRLSALPRATSPSPERARVLIVQLAEAGSMVLADPAIRYLKESGCEVFCLTLDRNRDSLAIAGSIPEHRILTLRSTPGGFLVDALRARLRIRAAGITAIADFELFTRVSALIAWWSGVAQRAGFHSENGEGLYRGDLFTRPVRFIADRHMAENYLAVARALPANPHKHVPAGTSSLTIARRQISDAAHMRMRQRIALALPQHTFDAPLLLVNANASTLLPQRRWPEERFVALIVRLLALEPRLGVLLIGGADDAPSSARLCTTVAHPRCASLAGQVSMADLPALFAQATVMVSNDSGPAHFAAVTPLPVVTLFGPETPTLFRPLGNAVVLTANLPCSPCVSANNQRRTDCRDNLCMQAIAVETVLEATLAVLRPARPSRAPATRALTTPTSSECEVNA